MAPATHDIATITTITTITTFKTTKDNMDTYDERINTTFKSWDPQSGEEWDNGPCGKCHPQGCLEDYNGYVIWQCRHGDWFVAQEEEAAPAGEHHFSDCQGNCAAHPLMTADTVEISRRIRAAGPSRTTWGDIMYEEEQAFLMAETLEQKQARMAAEAEHERKGKQEIVKYLVHRKEEKWTKGGEMKFRVPRPCKYATLYAERTCSDCGAKVPEGATVCKAMKGHRVCDQEFAGCWNHEQTKTCIYVHPDEPQWADACSGALCYDRQAQCFHLRGAEPAQANRFTVAARQEGFRPTAGGGAPRHEERREHNHSRHAGGGAARPRYEERPRYGGAGGGGAGGGGQRQDDGWEQAGKRSRR